MTHIRPYGFAYRLIWVLIAIAFFASGGCGSRQIAPQGPPVDQDLERTNRAARTAFENGRHEKPSVIPGLSFG